MKSSWSSPTPASLDPSIYTQRSGCILSLLRRMLCSTSLPTHPSESVMDEKKLAAEKAVPSLVARLMGLDSIPERMITRSRSLNSADHLKKEEDVKERSLGKKLHRRSKSSRSFRESPTHMELDDDEFIVLRFDNGPPKKSLHRRSRDKTSSAGNDEELPQSSTEREQEDHNQRRAGNSRTRKQIRLVEKKVTAESSDSEESSPVSIFDFQGTDTPTSAEEDSWTRSSSSSSSRVSVSSPEPDKTKISTDQDGPRSEEVECEREQALLKNTVVVNGQKRNREMWVRVCDITVAEIKGAAEWGDKDAKDLAAELEVHITDQLLNELLHSI